MPATERRLQPSKEDWHLEKKTSLSMIGALLLQAAILVWFLAQMHFTQNVNVTRLDDLEQNNIVQEAKIQELSEMNIHLKYMGDDINDIKEYIEKNGRVR